MSLKRISEWERNSDDTKPERFRCSVQDVNGVIRIARLSRTRPGARKANYGWRLIIKGFGNLSIGYWGDSEATAKRYAAAITKRMSVRRNARRLVISKCHAHGTIMVSVEDDDGAKRLTPDKCCGLWSEVSSWAIDDRMARDLAEEFSA